MIGAILQHPLWIAAMLIVFAIGCLFRLVGPDVNWRIRLKMLEAGSRFTKLRRSGPLTLMAVLGGCLVLSSTLSAIHIDGKTGKRTNYGVVSQRFVTTVGVTDIAAAFAGAFTLSNYNYHASGTGTTAENIADTALVTEVETRVAGTQSNPSAGVYRTVATQAYTATRTIAEHGIFNQLAAGGHLLDRSVFSGSTIGVVNGDSIQWTYNHTVTAGG